MQIKQERHLYFKEQNDGFAKEGLYPDHDCFNIIGQAYRLSYRESSLPIL